MKIAYGPIKRERALRERGLDFVDAAALFEAPTLTLIDDRFDYGEVRYLTYGLLGERLMMVAWTKRGDAHHIISMRKCNDREKTKITHRLGKG
jgi:uncharacterized DUF497 family protein